MRLHSNVACRGPARRTLWLACLGAAVGVAHAGGAMAEEAEVEAEAEAEAAAPAVPLEKLLTLPAGVEATAPRYGGATRREWRNRFDEARSKLAAARKALLEAQTELGEIAAETDQWQMNAPGLGGVQAASGDKGPMSYRLHQEIRRQREEIERGERLLQELRVEANLAGVPKEWIEPEPPEAAAAGGPPGS